MKFLHISDSTSEMHAIELLYDICPELEAVDSIIRSYIMKSKRQVGNARAHVRDEYKRLLQRPGRPWPSRIMKDPYWRLVHPPPIPYRLFLFSRIEVIDIYRFGPVYEGQRQITREEIADLKLWSYNEWEQEEENRSIAGSRGPHWVQGLLREKRRFD